MDTAKPRANWPGLWELLGLLVAGVFVFACGATIGLIGYGAARADRRRRTLSTKNGDTALE